MCEYATQVPHVSCYDCSRMRLCKRATPLTLMKPGHNQLSLSYRRRVSSYTS